MWMLRNEKEREERRERRKGGRKEGSEEGRKEGKKERRKEGRKERRREGRTEGKKERRKRGRKEGIEEIEDLLQEGDVMIPDQSLCFHTFSFPPSLCCTVENHKRLYFYKSIRCTDRFLNQHI